MSPPAAIETQSLYQALPTIIKGKPVVSQQPDTGILVPKKNLDQQTPLESISHGSLSLPGIPTFNSIHEERAHITAHIAAAFRYWARQGFTEGMSGHISVRDPEIRNAIWMNPLGIHYGLLKASDMILLDMDTGAQLGGNRTRPANEAGFLIHRAVHQARPDVHSVCHAHTIAARAFSTFRRPLRMLTQDVCDIYGAHAVYDHYGGIVFGDEEGRRIAAALGKHNKGAILMNHGLLTVGHTVDEATFLFGLMERSCEIELKTMAAEANGEKAIEIPHEEAAFNAKMAGDAETLYWEFQPDYDFEYEACNGKFVDFKGL